MSTNLSRRAQAGRPALPLLTSGESERETGGPTRSGPQGKRPVRRTKDAMPRLSGARRPSTAV